MGPTHTAARTSHLAGTIVVTPVLVLAIGHVLAALVDPPPRPRGRGMKCRGVAGDEFPMVSAMRADAVATASNCGFC